MKTLFISIVGSRLYGINKPDSDYDYKGFCLPDIDTLVGLKNFEQQEWKGENDEGTIFSLRKFLHLCMRGNPTVLELAFTDPKYHLFSTPLGLEIRSFIRKNLITKQVFGAYSSYFRSQLRKLDRPERAGKRQDLIDLHGWDAKFAAHAFRLGLQCVQLLKYKELRPTLSSGPKKMCLAIRNYELDKEVVRKILLRMDVQMYIVYKKSNLPELPDFELVNRYLTDIQGSYIIGDL